MATESAPATAPTPAAALWEDFVDILYAPAAVFARRRNAGFGVPLLVVTLCVGVAFLVVGEALGPVMEAEFNRAMASRNNPQLPPEAIERMRSVGAIIARVAAFVFTPLLMLLGGVFLWLGGKAVGARQTLRAACMVAAYAHVPRAIEGVVNGLQAVAMDPEGLDGANRLSLGPARFLDPDTTSPLVIAVTGPIDLFTLWVTVLLAVGLAETGGISRSRAALAAAFVWVVTVLPRVFGALSQM